MTIANVALTDTFDYWRTVTNSLVVALNDNILYFRTANANTVSLTATGGRQSNIFMNVVTTSSFTDVSSSNIASTLAVNAVHSLAISFAAAGNNYTNSAAAASNTWANTVGLVVGVGANSWANTIASAANSNARISIASANAWSNTVGLAVGVGANSWANIVVSAANSNAGISIASANAWSNTKLSNTSGVSFAGSLRIPGGVIAPVFTDTAGSGNFFAIPSGVSNMSNVVAQTAMMTPILYDINDPSWYLDPDSRSRLVALDLSTNQWIKSTDGFDRIRFEGSSSFSTFIHGGTGAVNNWYIRLGTSNDGVTRSIFEGNGNFYTTGNITAYWSDERLKKNITKIENWREIISGINGYWFEWNDLGKKILGGEEPGVQAGLIAQEVNAVLPQAAAVQMMQYKDSIDGKLVPKEDINYDPENPYLTVREEKIVPVLIEAIKGLMAEVDELKKKLP